MTAPRRVLSVLDAQIEARARAIRETHAFWPCAQGCDLCCRSLPHLPTIAEPEWVRLREALRMLPAPVLAEVLTRTWEAEHAPAPVTCPILDRERGACLAYAARPVACRTYGFYVERDAGLHCERVTRAVEEHGAAERVVWGNGEAVLRELRALGEPRSLAEWMRASS
jgi:Fe-S-cluster containining protein